MTCENYTKCKCQRPSSNKVAMNTTTAFVYLLSMAALSLHATAKLSSCDKEYDLQSQKYLLSEPSLKQTADSWSKLLPLNILLSLHLYLLSFICPPFSYW